MARLRLSMPTELGLFSETRAERSAGDTGARKEWSTTDADPRILRWLACWAGAGR